MQIDKLSYYWLFERHSKQVLSKWLKQLRYFYFKRAWGGHANDGDEFQVAFSFVDKQDLLYKIGQLGLSLNIIPDNYPKPVIGQSYSTVEFEKFKNEIKPYPDLEQPGHSKILGHKAFIWIHENSIKITISGTKDGNGYEVTEDDFKVCLELEKHFDNLGWQSLIDKSLEKSVCCISQKKYPELFGEETTLPNNTLPQAGSKWWQKLFGT